jgi:ADP-heptose:LPS heptosyltransferase
LNYPNAEITVQTAYPAVFRDNPHADYVIGPETAAPFGHDDVEYLLADLDLAYEMQPDRHIVDAYMRRLFGGLGDGDLQQELFFDRRPLFSGTRRRYAAVHAARAGWRNRTLPTSTWLAVLAGLRENGLWPILVGTERDRIETPLASACIIPDIHVQAQLIDNCAVFIGSDSALLHVAGATNTPIVGIFTSVHAEYRMPLRANDNSVAIRPRGLDCIGCQVRAPIPATTESCERGDIACVREVRAEDIILAAVGLAEGWPRT